MRFAWRKYKLTLFLLLFDVLCLILSKCWQIYLLCLVGKLFQSSNYISPSLGKLNQCFLISLRKVSEHERAWEKKNNTFWYVFKVLLQDIPLVSLHCCPPPLVCWGQGWELTGWGTAFQTLELRSRGWEGGRRVWATAFHIATLLVIPILVCGL